MKNRIGKYFLSMDYSESSLAQRIRILEKIVKLQDQQIEKLRAGLLSLLDLVKEVESDLTHEIKEAKRKKVSKQKKEEAT